MPVTAEQVLSKSHIGTSLVFEEHPIAEITAKKNGWIEIRDLHGKQWRIKPEQLIDVKFRSFLSDLARSIARSSPDASHEGSARAILGKMNVGDSLHKGNKILGTLIAMHPHTQYGPSLTFRDACAALHDIYLNLLPKDLIYADFLDQFELRSHYALEPASEPLLSRYFKAEFIPKILAQLDYEHECWGDTWLMPPAEGQEKQIRKRIMEHFDLNEQFDKDVPWLKIAEYAITAQAREDHPEWLL